MNIGIITFHRASNYGAALQAYALSTFVKSQGHHCDIVDYRSRFMEQYYKPFFLKSKNLKSVFGAIVNAPIRAWRRNSFEDFRRKHLSLSSKFSEETLKEANNLYDMFIFGSDQVWNYALSGEDSNFLGAFASDKKRLNAYAASFGRTQIEQKHWDEFKRLLLRYQNIGIREKSGCKLFKEITGKDAREVVDPVFLLEADEWSKLCSDKKKYGKYIMLYHLQGDRTRIADYAQYLSRQTGLPIVDVQAWAKKYPPNVRLRFGDSPCDFLGWIRDAEYVVTDSFHCTSLSIIFEKNFWSKVDENIELKKTRVGNLLHNIGLENRLIPIELQRWNFSAKCDYTESRILKNQLIEESKGFLDIVLTD